MKKQHGVTLVELMVVVAIVGILATIGSVAYGRYMQSGKVESMKQLALQVGAGQERYRARNNGYWPIAGGQMTYNAASEAQFRNLLDFDQNVNPDVIITTESWDGTGAGCTICGASIVPDATIAGYAVRVVRNLNAGEPADTTVIVTSQSPNPMVENEGD